MAVNINVPSQVRTFANIAAFPASGAVKTIYIAEDTNKTYRWDGSTYVEISASAATSLTIGTTPIASGTIGRVLFQGTGNVLQQSSSLFWDGTNNRLGIGTSSPLALIHLEGSVTASSAIARNQLINGTLVAAANSDTLVGLDINSTFTNGAFTGVSNLLLRASIAGTTKASITKDGDIILNGVTGANSPAISVFTSGTSAYFQNYYNPTDNALYWQSVGSYHNTTKMVFRNFQQNTGLAIFSTGNAVLGGNPATATDAGFRLDVNGTARFTGQTTYATTMNFGGNTDQISPSSNSGNFDFISNLPIRFVLRSGSVERMRIVSSTGNVLINTTTDAGFRLDVNGTARVVGQLSSGASGSNGSIALRRTSDGNIVGSFYTEGGGVVVKEHTGTGGVLLNGFDTTSLKWMGNASQPRVGIGFNGTINATCHIKGAFATSATSSLLIENSAGTAAMRVRDDLVILLPSLPTSPTGLPTGAIWNNLGILTIV